MIEADLVVDATGRGTRLPRRLADAGFPLPGSVVVDGKITYASRLYTLQEDPGQNWFASYQPTLAPTHREAPSPPTSAPPRGSSA
ncbi:hypothetical protein DY245_18070 [Streptomyces inhibens]|uniref:FAD-binding domain-containing protein n=1 Tax=Streptomyces inhibens TaxID=2293571 RepID=A0A371Q2R2_STRIH|nr:hypothetical protein [Streptomyces inhibens]REK89000.1 hypothetical protein DY245_18070 [Streptomyces inhibens]